MNNLKVILSIFLIACSSYYLCHAEKYTENTRSNRTARGLASTWIYVDPTDKDQDTREILWIASQVLNNLNRGGYNYRRFDTNGGFRGYEDFEFRESGFTPTRPSSGRPPSRRPPPVSPALPIPAQLTNDPNPCNWELPQKPNFLRPGRRISEAKCDEFHFDARDRALKSRKNSACNEYRKNHPELGQSAVYPVFGGRISKPGEFSHMGALGWRAVEGGWKFQCGATLISEQHLLTAAHCSSASRRDPTIANTVPEIVRLGVSNLDEINIDSKIANIIVHPQYVSPKTYNDIAVVVLMRAVEFVNGYIQPACLWTRQDTSPLGNQAFVSGWGLTESGITATDLQVAEVDIIDSTTCNMLLRSGWNRNFMGLMFHQMCAGVLKGGIDTCKGDSGGPLQVKIPSSSNMSYIIAVTSFGRGCARPYSPGVYTRVASFIDWIENTVWPR